VRRLTVYVSLLVMLDLALFSAIVPLLPHFAQRLNLSKLETGVLLGSYSAAVVVAAVPVGHLADRIGMRTVTIAGSLLMAAATATFALGDSYIVLVAARLAQGLASAVAWSAALGWLAGAVPENRRGTEIGYANASATGGMVAGPILGGAVAGALGVRETFLIVAAASLLMAVWGAFETSPPAVQHREPSMRPALRAAVSEPLITVSLIVIVLVALVGGTLQVLIPLHLGDAGVSQSTIGWLYAAGAVLGSISIALTGRAGDRIGRLPVAQIDCVLLMSAVLVLVLPLGSAAFATMLVVIAPILSVLYGVGYPMGADGADRAGLGHGLALGLVNLVWGIGAVVGPVTGGALAGFAGDRAAYLVLAGLCLAAALVMRSRGLRQQRA
jgi:DHA1 family solute carrier family 18 vesicular amine transporter 1/2